MIMVSIALTCSLKIYIPSCRSSKFSSILVCWTMLVNTWLEHIRAALRIMISFTAHLRDFQLDTEKRYFSVSKAQNKLKKNLQNIFLEAHASLVLALSVFCLSVCLSHFSRPCTSFNSFKFFQILSLGRLRFLLLIWSSPSFKSTIYMRNL